MFGQQKIVPGNVAIIVIGDSNVEQDVQNHGKIKQRKVKPVALIAHQILHRAINSKNPEWLYQKVEEKQ